MIKKINTFAKSLNKYVVRENALEELGFLIKSYGKKAYIIGGSTALSVSQSKIVNSLEKEDIAYKFELFDGVCSTDEINQIEETIKKYSPDLLIGVGGGKAMDFSKAVAYYNSIPVVTIPTIPSNCSSWVPTSVIYSNEGVPSGSLKTNAPEYVISDLTILRKSPRKYFAAGLVDSLAKWPELGLTDFGDENDLLYESGLCVSKFISEKCMILAQKTDWYGSSFSELIPNLDMIIDINIAITGICSELTAGAMTSGNLPAVAHGIDEALLAISRKSHNYCHGERVAFGLLPHMLIYNADKEFIYQVIKFCLSLNLPLEFNDFKLDNNSVSILSKRVVESIGMRGSKIKPREIEESLKESQSLIKKYQENNFE